MDRGTFEGRLTEWAGDVKAEALRLFDAGALPQECIGLAIQVIESRRRKTAAARQQFAPMVAGVQRN